MNGRPRWMLSFLALALIATACQRGGDELEVAQTGGQAEGEQGSVLETVKDRGKLVCGVEDSVPGFGFVTPEGEFQGFDIDFCKAVAAAVLGDAKAVEFKPLTAEQRFPALQAAQVDVLIRNTTWTATRDGREGAQFVTTTFYDSQGIMVKADSRVQRLEDLNGATICTLSGTTTELNLETAFRARGLEYTPLAQEENDPLVQAFIQGRCDAYTSDKSQLAGLRSKFPANAGGPEGVRLLDVTMSKEPLGPAVRQGDAKWFDAVNWTVLATIQAEEFGITSDNLDEMTKSGSPDVKAFLGQPTAQGKVLDPGLGLPTDFAAKIVSQVGNYAEIYDHNVGSKSALRLERDLNALWSDGGLMYAPPYR